ncbi:hypothetical protein GCM10009836_49430 [Pseudonocardia ailaonensis]|uniref:Uncharacterized protein n=1 Tax=Pseudonocardia ailaonensis TaxID=367279 RepID=A0ABN2NCJ8_9PSEU
MAQERRTPFRWFAEGGWWFFAVVLSIGMLVPVPFVHAATRLRTSWAWIWAAVYTAVEVGLIVAVQKTDTSSNNSALGGVMVGVIVIAICHLVALRRRVWATAPTSAYGSTDPAVAAAMAARARREEARRIAAQDPALARELKIGRPDLMPRTYDDGGLVDLAGAPTLYIAIGCDIDPAIAHRIEEARQAQPLTSVDDVFAFTDIPYPLWDRIRDRGVVVR